MIIPYKNRTIDRTKKVEVYRNLNNECFSIKQDGIVVAHADDFVISNVTPKVSEAGRQRVLREKRKNVHAVLVGYNPISTNYRWFDTNKLVEIYYDPYTLDSFINMETKQCFIKSDYVYFKNGKAYILDSYMLNNNI